ncbi:MAG TPA: TIGR03118 family protein, partial [Planctomycetaceae bacterium]
MKLLGRSLAIASLIAICIVGNTSSRADDEKDRDLRFNGYVTNKLTSNVPGQAANTDPVLQNAWGVTFTPGNSPFWISDNATGCSTLYDGQGIPQPLPPTGPLKVKIPLPNGDVSTACKPADPQNPPSPTPAGPTGLVWNPTSTFLVPNMGRAATFIFSTENGTLAAWTGGLSPPDVAVLAFTSKTAVYKGLVFGTNPNGVFLFATNFHDGTVDVFKPADSTSNGQYIQTTTTGGFTDSNIPKGYAPFGIENIDGDLFVSYAKQDAAKHDDVAGPGNGFVDVFDTDGNLLRRFASRGPLNSPWGMTRASFDFGRFSGLILVGNFGNGKINVFSSQGQFIDELDRPNGKPLVIDGLWKLILGGG